ncbi:PDZ domain-containing protein [Thermoflavimicrobium dichotomicum]|uniref:PDZ domain-containing protein n=1 Tax=Thermoflavimicrobium dichotomicum TaxID=46223 RepID=A0A1I3JV08_9BACL|nr:PDZ domain-containing protein [Thermoflavimicrobium dichotomicum]SFI63996.1 PDZ domain-containing protein [Thermoflavimicrobium dichotomicum]
MFTFPQPFWSAWLRLFIDPFWLTLFLLPVLHIGYLRWREKKQFGKIIHAPIPLVLRTWCLGLAVGFLLSCLLIKWKFVIRKEEVLLVWGLTLCLGIWRIRFACISYVAGLLSLVSLASKKWGLVAISLEGYHWWKTIVSFSVENWLWLVGLTHLLEWGLVRLSGADGSLPVQVHHRLGQPVHAFLLSKIWTVPFVLLTHTGWLIVPVIIGFSSKNASKPVLQQKRFVSTFVLIFACSLCIVLILSMYWRPLLWMAAILSFSAHELFYWWEQWRERKRKPLFVSTEQGLKVLVVLPFTPAAEMGIKSGDIIHRLNGVRIFTVEDLKRVTDHAAFLKLEILDERMDKHYLQKALYEDDPKDLGIIGAISIWQTNIKSKELDVGY